MTIAVTDHAIDRARERVLSSSERARTNLAGYIATLWRGGGIEERWRDPNDPPGALTLTREITPAWDGDGEPRYLVARREGHKVVIVSALTAEQYHQNARARWGEPR